MEPKFLASLVKIDLFRISDNFGLISSSEMNCFGGEKTNPKWPPGGQADAPVMVRSTLSFKVIIAIVYSRVYCIGKRFDHWQEKIDF